MKIGLVLSGGGIRGIAHLGVLQALTEAGIKFDKISGTSAGSIVGALFAQGIEPAEVLKIFMKTHLYKYIRPAFKSKGLMSLDKIRTLLLEYIPHDSFAGLKTPMVITTTNFNECKVEYFSSGELINPILASSAIPVFFKPILIGKKIYMDGGILNNFPVEPVISDCDFIIGSSCNHLPETNRIESYRRLVERAIIMSINSDMAMKAEHCDVIIEPKGMGATSVFDVGKTEEIYWLAYDATLRKLKTDKKLQSILPDSKNKKGS
ncbi:MAG: patatin-like phospholipase family protein [Pedobacter sp.]|jgi:NTE family protein